MKQEWSGVTRNRKGYGALLRRFAAEIPRIDMHQLYSFQKSDDNFLKFFFENLRFRARLVQKHGVFVAPHIFLCRRKKYTEMFDMVCKNNDAV